MTEMEGTEMPRREAPNITVKPTIHGPDAIWFCDELQYKAIEFLVWSLPWLMN